MPEDIKDMIPADPVPAVEEQPVVTEENTPETQPQPQPQEPKTNRAFAEMRTRNTQYERVLNNVAKQMGITVDELLAQQQDQADDKAAKQLGVPKEYQTRLRQMEEQLTVERQERQKERFLSGVLQLKSTYNLKQDDLYGFVDQAKNAGIDLMATNMPLDTVYKALNYDTLVKQAVENARQEWLKNDSDRSNHSPSNTKNPSRPVSNVANINDALADLFGKK